ncbi:hypothetical protein F2Q69_00049278 [Brassica cretica]|uniref:Uncharacterized protein n=1 Tax=Brassica cretica TaxID=69181 RepID=A0A8S9PVK4_BRACR|nr:hypothetical protein F2Q69_00049278 [Brassica cretica]
MIDINAHDPVASSPRKPYPVRPLLNLPPLTSPSPRDVDIRSRGRLPKPRAVAGSESSRSEKGKTRSVFSDNPKSRLSSFRRLVDLAATPRMSDLSTRAAQRLRKTSSGPDLSEIPIPTAGIRKSESENRLSEYDLADDYGLLFSPHTAVGALYSQLKELHKKNADMEERDKMLYSKGLPFLCRKTDPVSFRSAFWFYSYPPSKYMKQFISQMQGDTDSTSSNTAESICKVEPLTIAELNYLSSLLHLRVVLCCMLHTVSAIAFVRCDNAHAVGTLRYRVETAIADGTAEDAFFCFDGVVTKLHSLRASEAGQMLSDGPVYMI